jgi:hypothetical protein
MNRLAAMPEQVSAILDTLPPLTQHRVFKGLVNNPWGQFQMSSGGQIFVSLDAHETTNHFRELLIRGEHQYAFAQDRRFPGVPF